MPDYDSDFYGWANEQAALLRAGRLGDADVANIAEEIESMGRSEKRELINRLVVLLQHLLKWRVQDKRRSTSWRLTIKEQRLRLQDHLLDNPSLTASLSGAISSAYKTALVVAQRETRLDQAAFPPICPWTPAEIMAEDFHPE